MGYTEKITSTLLILITLPFIGYYSVSKLWSLGEYNYYLSSVPKELNITKISYMQNYTGGFGPGGNETGIIIYELPENISQIIASKGIEYLRNLPSNNTAGHGWRGHFSKWSPTPIAVTRYWVDYMSFPDDTDYSNKSPSISHYLNAYGFGIAIPKEISKMVDNAIANPESYYAYGRVGIIIVIPSAGKVVYAYNG